MLHYADTTVFNVGAQVIVNTVNCVGVMGNGLALECRLRFPAMFADYVARCRRGEVRIGRPYLYWESPDLGILNFPVKEHWKFPARLEWVEQSLQGFRSLFAQNPVRSVAFPVAGCHLGKLDSSDVLPMMEQALADLPCDIHICYDCEEHATGVEGAMVAMLNGEDGWAMALGLRRETAAAIQHARPLRRLRELRTIPGVGKQTYERVHQWLLMRVCGRREAQGTLFG